MICPIAFTIQSRPQSGRPWLQVSISSCDDMTRCWKSLKRFEILQKLESPENFMSLVQAGEFSTSPLLGALRGKDFAMITPLASLVAFKE